MPNLFCPKCYEGDSSTCVLHWDPPILLDSDGSVLSRGALYLSLVCDRCNESYAMLGTITSPLMHPGPSYQEIQDLLDAREIDAMSERIWRE